MSEGEHLSSQNLQDSEDEAVEDAEDAQDLKNFTRPELLNEITKIWQDKKVNNEKLVKLSDEIQSTKDEIKGIRENMAIESNDLNVIGNEIRKIEDKIKDLTNAGKTGNRDKNGEDGHGDGQGKK